MKEATQRLLEFGQDYADFAAACWRQLQAAQSLPAGAGHWPGVESLLGVFEEHYRRMLAPAMPPEIAAAATMPGLAAALARCQRAAHALGAETAAIALDASRRLSEELARTDAAATPVTTLRALHGLWVECGERAWSAAVRQDAYAAALSEWLAALVELQCEQQRLQQAAGAGQR